MSETMVEMNDEKLKNLAKDPTNLVYHWKHRDRLPDDQVLSLTTVKDKVLRLFGVYTDLRQRFIMKNIPIRQKHWNYIKIVIEKDPEWQQFSYTHPLIFDRVIHPETTEREIKALIFMIYLRDRPIPNGPEVLTQYLLDEFGMTQAEWDQVKERDGIKN